MSEKYSIDRATKTLTFTGNPKSLKKDSIGKEDKAGFTSVVIPNSVSTIAERTLKYCHALASVHIPNSVSVVGDEAFTHCASLASIHIPSSVSTLGGWSFQCCFPLIFIHLPHSVNTIGGCAFSYCSHLHKVCLPSNLKIDIRSLYQTFEPKTALVRPRLKPVSYLQKKSACRASKATYSIYL